MELLHLFIKDHNKFKNQNINFGSEYIFNYSVENEELIVEKNNLYIKSFYATANKNDADVLNVSSIIGENGTGKTSILKLISENFPSGFNLKIPLIFITKEKGEITVNHTEEFKIKNDLNIYGFKTKKIRSKKEKLEGEGLPEEYFISFGYDLRGLNKTNFIYFSNIFDLTGGIEIKDFFDISTNYLVYGDFNTNVNNKIIERNPKNDNPLRNFMFNDVFRQIKFIHKFYNSKLIPFKIPELLRIQIKNDYLKNGINDKTFQNTLAYNQIQKLIVNLIKSETKLDTGLEKIKIRLIANIYLSFIVDFFYSYQSIDQHLETKTIVSNAANIDVATIIKTLDEFDKHQKKHLNSRDLSLKIKNIIELLQIIWAIDNSNQLFKFETDTLFVNIEKDNFEIFDKFIDTYTKSYIIRPFLDITWGNISSGEKALLNIYSRFYSLINEEHFGDELDEHLIIMIDEGDLYLHPAWQKRFVKLLLDFLPKIYNSKRNGQQRTIQIIFTTNSPIPASDLLSYNTIFLENVTDENGEVITVVKDSLNDQKDTFAANIHTLLSDSFFVKNGLIGEFASGKLNEIIDKLIKRVELNYEDREKMRRLIYQIGEPILKTKLMQMYNDRFNMEIHERLGNIEKHLGL